jgi:ectoine hydroxylase-related dioxygenase (phytanoyl-CoA dioxygenase family)
VVIFCIHNFIFLFTGTLDHCDNGPKFYFPELKVFMKLQPGDILVFKPSQLYHCTRSSQSSKHLGLSVFQKWSYFRALKKNSL